MAIIAPPLPRRRISGFWVALIVIILMVLIVAGMVFYRGSQTPPIITAQSATLVGGHAVAED